MWGNYNLLSFSNYRLDYSFVCRGEFLLPSSFFYLCACQTPFAGFPGGGYTWNYDF